LEGPPVASDPADGAVGVYSAHPGGRLAGWRDSEMKGRGSTWIGRERGKGRGEGNGEVNFDMQL